MTSVSSEKMKMTVTTTVQTVSLKSPDFRDIIALRNRYLGNNPAGECGFDEIENMRDLCSQNLGYYHDNKLIGAIRITPVGHGLTLAEKLLTIDHYYEQPFKVLDANRLVLSEEYRGGRFIQNFLLQTTDWLKNNTLFHEVSALCRTRLTPLYVDIGGRVVEQNIPWDSQGVKRDYTLVSLKLDTIKETIKRRNNDGSFLQRTG